jgi:RNA polymerase sigma-70 factor, ECF subfamily
VPAETAAVADLENHREELTVYCRRTLGSAFDADDAVQETMVRAWRGLEQFEGRASLRSWLYRIATNVCCDMRRGPWRRTVLMDLGPSGNGDIPGARPPATDVSLPGVLGVGTPGSDPADTIAAREEIRRALSALVWLPRRQRAAVILCDVLRWPAAEAAAALRTTRASVNSALQRGRQRFAAFDVSTPVPGTACHDALRDRFVDAFARHDVDALVRLVSS